ncbi:Protein EMSY-LIKE 3 [Striga hermonthica]|uniref:Protein EMSY-LIKE 3 n=1 Tax=Striga hermonthica TaxID=68872 RepID=A0A9N7RB52_STRHE|nr:Protein EMSY-LIKE 3 [Striga hermonthica]
MADDSSDTPVESPQPHQNRMSRGGWISGNGRPAAMGSHPFPRNMYDDNDMEAKIHQLEQEAYSSVLRAFKAQGDAITWEKESLITELRKELRLSNEEHRDLLSRVNSDETIRRIREWRQSVERQASIHGASQGAAAHDPAPSPSISASRKKQKGAPSLPSQSFGGPSPFHPQPMAQMNQPLSSASKRGPMMGGKGKKHKSLPTGPSSMKMQYPQGPAGRGQFGNRMSSGVLTNEPAEGGSFDPLIGRKVRTRWPDDNNFYEAVITDYNPAEGRHALVYDIGTQNETWEWVNLSEISPEDIKWEGEEPGVSRRGGLGVPGHGISRPRDNNGPGPGRGRGLTKSQPRKDFPPSQNGIGTKGPDEIQLLHTDTLIREIERVFSAGHPDPMEIEKAKKVLKEQELALNDAIARLADLSDDESGAVGRLSVTRPSPFDSRLLLLLCLWLQLDFSWSAAPISAQFEGFLRIGGGGCANFCLGGGRLGPLTSSTSDGWGSAVIFRPSPCLWRWGKEDYCSVSDQWCWTKWCGGGWRSWWFQVCRGLSRLPRHLFASPGSKFCGSGVTGGCRAWTR